MLRKLTSPEMAFEKLQCTTSGELVVPAVVVDFEKIARDAVLMVAFMNREALDCSIDSGRGTFYSRSRNGLWTKGETSGNFLQIRGMYVDCDNDTLLIDAVPAGPTCHTGEISCFNTKAIGE